jgi:hypothetical protein
MLAQRQCSADATAIAAGLYQGGEPPTGGELRRCGFTTLVLCAEEHQLGSAHYPGVAVIHAPADDAALTDAAWRTAAQAAALVASRLRAGERVLVTCHAGRNRSGLVSALALHMLTGISGAEAARIVRSRRRAALTNRWFLAALFRVPARGRAERCEAGLRRRA